MAARSRKGGNLDVERWLIGGAGGTPVAWKWKDGCLEVERWLNGSGKLPVWLWDVSCMEMPVGYRLCCAVLGCSGLLWAALGCSGLVTGESPGYWLLLAGC